MGTKPPGTALGDPGQGQDPPGTPQAPVVPPALGPQCPPGHAGPRRSETKVRGAARGARPGRNSLLAAPVQRVWVRASEEAAMPTQRSPARWLRRARTSPVPFAEVPPALRAARTCRPVTDKPPALRLHHRQSAGALLTPCSQSTSSRSRSRAGASPGTGWSRSVPWQRRPPPQPPTVHNAHVKPKSAVAVAEKKLQNTKPKRQTSATAAPVPHRAAWFAGPGSPDAQHRQ